MSNFLCEKCGCHILDSPKGYITKCKHYKTESIKKKQKKDYKEDLLFFRKLFQLS